MKKFSEFLQEEREKKDQVIISNLNEMKAKLEELKPTVDKYYEIQRKYDKKKKAFDQQKKYEILSKLKRETKYIECEYPDMGCSGEDGSAFFKDEEQANSLIQALRSNSNYYYAYILEWKGEGEYIVEPDWKYDHDGETVYTAYFKKKGVEDEK